jgi:predicted nucleic acid-binding protein
MAIVLDASVTAAWLLPDEFSPVAEACRNALLLDTAIVPAIWPLEVCNLMLMAERRGRINPVGTAVALEYLADFPIVPDFDQPDRDRTMDLARRYKLTAYDAAYLELALRLDLPLSTLDGPLSRAAMAANARLFSV